MNKLRVGVVGVGYLGKFHAQKYARMEDVELVAVVDIDGDRSRRVARENTTQALKDYRELFGQVDAVSVAVPTKHHFEIAKAFLERNSHVLIEKPITVHLQEADELIRIADSKGLLIQVGHLERFNPAVVALTDILRTPRFIESHRLSFYNERGTDVSVVLDLMIHDIDIICNFVKSDLIHVHAAGIPVITEEVDIANARLEFENGCVANVTASRISAKSERKIRLFQRDAYISVDFANHDITVIRKADNQLEGIIPGMGIDNLSFDKGDALDDELKSFVRAIQNGRQPEVTGRMGRDALKVALSIMKQIDLTSNRFFS
jgi:predicted dehydrogenase